jgi:hypothetical protein
MGAIFDDEPADWSELQILVARLFSEIGGAVKLGEHVKLVRGEKEIDVLVRDTQTIPASVYLVECKFWNKAIPQEVIHAFRTVVADFGANHGFIVSRVGFQAGAKAAIRNTNVTLLTFEELQTLFFDRWRAAMGSKYRPESDQLFPYWDYPGRMPRIRWQKEHIQRQQLLIEAYRPLIQVGPLFESRGFTWELPMTLPRLNAQGLHDGTITLRTYREVYDFIEQNKQKALREFQILYGEIEP